MEVKVIQAEGVRFKVEAREHSLICDQPQDNGGTDQGMTPPELMLASLGTCAAFYAAQFLKARNLADGGVEVRVTAEKLKHPARLGNFQVDVSCPVPLTPEQEQGMMNAVHHCLIHNTLLTPPQIDIKLHLPQTVG
jgi:putative redox protein